MLGVLMLLGRHDGLRLTLHTIVRVVVLKVENSFRYMQYLLPEGYCFVPYVCSLFPSTRPPQNSIPLIASTKREQ